MTVEKQSEGESSVSAPPGAKRRRRAGEVRARVLAEALHEFATHGFEGTSMGQIARRAHVSLPLLLYHFTSKEELWKTLMRHVIGDRTIAAIVQEAVADGLDAADQLRRIIRHAVTSFSQNPALHRLMTNEAHQPSDRLIWLCDTFGADDYHLVCRIIIEGQADGRVRDIEPGRLRFAIIAMAATPFAVSAEYQYLTRRNPFHSDELDHAVQMIEAMVFTGDTVDKTIPLSQANSEKRKRRDTHRAG